MTDLKVLAALVLLFPSGAIAQHVPDLSPHAVGLMSDPMLDELLVACRDRTAPDWLTADECQRLSKERERRTPTQSSSQPEPK